MTASAGAVDSVPAARHVGPDTGVSGIGRASFALIRGHLYRASMAVDVGRRRVPLWTRAAVTGVALLCAFVELGPVPAAARSSSPQSPPDIVVYASELPRRALSEFEFWEDPASPGGRLAGTRNTGDELDPPPENDPHVAFDVRVRGGVAYRCWIHMKVGPPLGVSRANMFWVQFTGAVDQAGDEALAPRTGSYLTARGPTQPGWVWVGCDPEQRGVDRLVRFHSSGEITVRLQAGMEGVGFDQFVLSPARYLEHPPTTAIVPRSDR